MLCVLIVDDESYVREGIARRIAWQQMGFDHVYTASQADEALKLAGSVHPDLVISDVRMPHMNGLDMFRHMTQILPNAKVIFISAYSEIEYYRAAMKMKAVSFVEKPVILEELSEQIARAALLIQAEGSARKPEPEANQVVTFIRREIEEHYADPDFSLAHLAQRLHLSENYISTLYKKETGSTISASIDAVRMEHAKALLRDPRNRISDVSRMVGIENTDYFSRRFRLYTGQTPSAYRR